MCYYVGASCRPILASLRRPRDGRQEIDKVPNFPHARPNIMHQECQEFGVLNFALFVSLFVRKYGRTFCSFASACTRAEKELTNFLQYGHF